MRTGHLQHVCYQCLYLRQTHSVTSRWYGPFNSSQSHQNLPTCSNSSGQTPTACSIALLSTQSTVQHHSPFGTPLHPSAHMVAKGEGATCSARTIHSTSHPKWMWPGVFGVADLAQGCFDVYTALWAIALDAVPHNEHWRVARERHCTMKKNRNVIHDSLA